MNRILLEVCVDDAAGIAAAVKGGADRIELCAALGLGGLTPSAGLMALAAEAGVPTMVMIRPRAGDFLWSAAEMRAMHTEIEAVRAAGLAGVVIGASCPDGRLDRVALAELAQMAAGLDLTLHRVIDLAPDPVEALELCVALGIRRVLTSGGARTAAEGMERLVAMQGHGVSVMPGGGVSVDNVLGFAQKLAVQEIHASCSTLLAPPPLAKVAAFGFQPPGARGTDPAQVRALRDALDQITASRPSG